jgi:hypothetical protein
MITIQLTEIPANETVTNRVFSLPLLGGDFGADFDCFIPLPDRSGQVKPVHGRFVPNQHGMSVESLNNGKINLNGVLLAPGRLAAIDDGTIIEIADYTLLISKVDTDELPNDIDKLDDINDASVNQAEPYFSSSELAKNNNEEVVMFASELERRRSKNGVTDENLQQPKAHFSASGVFSDDPFGDDPFAEEDITWQHKSQHDEITSDERVSIHVEEVDTHYQKNVKNNKTNKAKNTMEAEVLPLNHYEEESKVDQLVELLDRQLANTNDQQKKLFQALDKTLSTFLEEFSPEHLEDTYSDYGRPLFVGKEQQYWRLFRKSFNRRLDKGEYQRLFKALLLENMQGGQD